MFGDGCEVREVEPLVPRVASARRLGTRAHFADCWAKLRMWEWEDEFDRLCYLDADMLVIKCIDELLDEDGTGAGALVDASEGGCRRRLQLAAVQECFCPVLERKPFCAYHQGAAIANSSDGRVRARTLNAGLLVLTPDAAAPRT